MLDSTPLSIAQALSEASQHLVSSSDSPEIDAVYLLEFVIGCNATYLRTRPEHCLTEVQTQQFRSLLAQRSTGVPVAYLTGARGFWSLDLKVTEATLIPRPDTELLVSLALEKAKPSMKVADLGTGSGAIALSIAHECPDIKVFAMDYSQPALEVARVNAKNNGLNNVVFWNGSWLDAIRPNAFDLIISNPPYIESDDPHLNQGDVRFEPLSALASGVDGLDDIRIIVRQAKQALTVGGWLMVEHGYNQSEQVKDCFKASGFDKVSAHQDFGGQDRVVIGQVTL